jgi:hypothetical protein
MSASDFKKGPNIIGAFYEKSITAKKHIKDFQNPLCSKTPRFL